RSRQHDYRRTFVAGRWADADGLADVINPATEEVIGCAPAGSARETDSAIATAREAFDSGSWPRMSGEQRATALDRVVAEIARCHDDIADMIVAETGTPMTIARSMHLRTGLAQFRFAIDYARANDGASSPPVAAPGRKGVLGAGVIRHEPRGVVAAITPFNYPFYINLVKVAAALAMGNSVVLKPSPFTPMSALALAEAIDRSELPPGVFALAFGDESIGAQLARDPRVDMVTFTGSETAGEAVMTHAATTTKKVTLALPGKSALIVRHDADVELAVELGLRSLTANAGQTCAMLSRHLIARAHYDEYIERLTQLAQQVVVGDPRDAATVVGPLIRQSRRERVERVVREALAQGATATCGGQNSPVERGFFYEPTVLTDVDPTWPIAQDETFGPVVTVFAFDSDDEAVHLANNSRFGLAAGIVSRDAGSAYAMACRLQVGTVNLNGGAGGLSPAHPFGGYKGSGSGREYGAAGLHEYTQTKSIMFHAG
ncbi:MAG: aldehyde dehydrogenase family protein, partial [Acidimicrobiales bacterium]